MFWRGFKALPDVLEGLGEVPGALNLPWGFQVNFRGVSERFQGIGYASVQQLALMYTQIHQPLTLCKNHLSSIHNKIFRNCSTFG